MTTAEIEKSTKTATGSSLLGTPPKSTNFQFVREDWTLFRSLSTLGQKAGVSVHRLGRLVLKELVDNALDAGGACEIEEHGETYSIIDAGPGLDPAKVADLFSIRRPLSSSKLLRLPTRGALGNGLRVVAGYVLATKGTLTVWTRGQRVELHPEDDGTTSAVVTAAPEFTEGTRIDITIRGDAEPTVWADMAIRLATGTTYRGRTSPHWYPPVAFWELCQAAGNRPVRELVGQFDGCSGAKAGTIAAPYKGRLASSLTRDEASELLALAKDNARPVPPKRLGRIGPDASEGGYAWSEGEIVRDGATIPFVVEAWARPRHFDDVKMCVNRTPITGEVRGQRDAKNRAELVIFGCNLGYGAKVGRDPISLLLNITTPFMPITTDGKEPDLDAFHQEIIEAVEKAARRARRMRPESDEKPKSQRDIIIENLDTAIAKASGNGSHRFAQRQLFYQLRPFLIDGTGKEPDAGYVCQVIGEIEDAQGHDIPGMYRDPRGILYHPHTHEEIPIGTLAVEQYQRPAWTFNKILYIEKEGFLSILREDGWPERNDCALLTSKGYSSRAVRDVLDLLGKDGEPLEFFAVHDADAAGTMIYQTLVGETTARPGRKVTIHNLGLEPEEALAMGLPSEAVHSKDNRARPVADYVTDRWSDWLQNNRVELNAMDTPQFIAWLDSKMAQYSGKVIPPATVLIDVLVDSVTAKIKTRLTEQAIIDAQIEERTAATMKQLAPKLAIEGEILDVNVSLHLDDHPEHLWSAGVEAIANKIGGPTP